MTQIGPHLGGPLSVVDDVRDGVVELRDALRALRPKLETALDAVPGVQQNLDTVSTYVPWLIGSIGFLGAAIIFHAIYTRRT